MQTETFAEIFKRAIIKEDRKDEDRFKDSAEAGLLIAAGEGDAEASFKAMNGKGDNDE